MSRKVFVYRNSVVMPILQIGELAKKLSDEYLLENRTIPWRAIMGMRDIFAHHYGSVDYQELWQTSHEDVGLRRLLIPASPQHFQEQMP